MNLGEWADRNPFTQQYVLEEVEHYGTESCEIEGVQILAIEPKWVVPDYLNKFFDIGGYQVPLFQIDGQTWMSLTRMELQSQHMAIQFAQDKVATLGLGMGHFVLRAMGNDDVDTVTVFEQDQRVVNLFQRFKDRPGFDKVTFVVGDARKLCQGHEFNYVYADIYPTMLCDQVAGDLAMLLDENHIEVIHWWGRERVLLSALQHQLGDFFDWPTMQYFRQWNNTPIEGDKQERPLSCMAHEPIDQEYVESILEVFNERGIDP